MANEKRLIDANALFAEMERIFCVNCNFYDGKCRECQYAIAADMLVDAPTVDAVEVVRCKDCKHQRKVWYPDRRMISKGYYIYQCDRNDDPFVSHTVTGHDHEFCPYGERREGE